MKKLLLDFAFFLLLQSSQVTLGSAPLNRDNLNSCIDSCHPLDCSDVAAQGLTSDGVYLIYPGGVNAHPVPVYCDMKSSGGPWTVFQKRFDGSVDFYRGWKEYKNGFGTASGEYWLGLQNIHLLTQKRSYRLRVDLMDFENDTRYGIYDTFSLSPLTIDPEEDGYKLYLGAFENGDINKPIGDSLRTQNEMMFSTHDMDRDTISGNCAVIFQGASWYKNCHSANLNGLYLKGETDQYAKGITWSGWKGQYYSLKIFLFLVLCHIQQITGVWSNTQPAPQQKTEVDGIPIDCQDVWDNGQPSSGVYIIYPQGAQRPLPVYCDMTTAGMVWTVFQRRLDGSVRFDRSWQDYVNGFGIADGEYWLGLQNIYRLTMFSDYELQVELEDSEGTWVWAKYENFSLSRHALNPDSDGYRLHIGVFTDGGAGDALSLHDGHMFSTYDRDRDGHIQNCANYWGGGFWYHLEGCAGAGLNARYNVTSPYQPAFSWTTWVDFPQTLRGSQMKIRRVPQ